MPDESRSRAHWTDERLNERFSGLDASIIETRKQVREQMADLKADFDEKHKANQETTKMLNQGQITMQNTLAVINQNQDKALILLCQIVGENGEPEEGRLGKLEKTVEVLKEFRWQVIAGAIAVGAILDHIFKLSTVIPKLF